MSCRSAAIGTKRASSSDIRPGNLSLRSVTNLVARWNTPSEWEKRV